MFFLETKILLIVSPEIKCHLKHNGLKQRKTTWQNMNICAKRQLHYGQMNDDQLKTNVIAKIFHEWIVNNC